VHVQVDTHAHRHNVCIPDRKKDSSPDYRSFQDTVINIFYQEDYWVFIF